MFTADEIKALHSDIKFVRTPRKAVKSTNDIRYFLSKSLLQLFTKASARYAFLEFGSAEECKAARGRLATTQYKGKELIVDFVGEVLLLQITFTVDLLPNLTKWI